VDVFLFSLFWQVIITSPCLYLELRYWRRQNVPMRDMLAALTAASGGLGPAIMDKLKSDQNQVVEAARDPRILTSSSAVMMSLTIFFQLLLLPCWFTSSHFFKDLTYTITIAGPVLQAAAGSTWIINSILTRLGIIRELKLIYYPNEKELKNFYLHLSPLMKTPDYIKRTLKQLEPGSYYEILVSSTLIPIYISIITGFLTINNYFPNILALAKKVGIGQITNLPIMKVLIFYSYLCIPFAVFHIPITTLLIYLLIHIPPYRQYKIIRGFHYIYIPTVLVILLKIVNS